MAIVFPTDPGAQTPVNTFSPTSSPVVNTTNNNRYLWNGVAWTVQNDSRYVNIAGDTMTGTLNAPSMNLVSKGSVPGYQQGAWTPTTNGFSEQVGGNWSRNGNLVTASFSFINNDAQTGTNPFHVDGLPYPRKTSDDQTADDALRCGGYLAWSSIGEPRTLMFGTGSSLSDVVQFRKVNTSSATDSITNAAGKGFRGTVIYLTSDTTWTPFNGATVD